MNGIVFNIGEMLAGLAFFLLAMSLMESSLKQLAGRSFKIFLKKQTSHKARAMAAGAIVTGLLQSSSVANLLVLGMLGSGIMQVEGALALLLGSNLGTTLNSWLLATVGFEYSIVKFAFPVAGITGLATAFIDKQQKVYHWLRFLFSLAFLFVSLEFIKEGMGEFVRQTDLSFFSNYPSILLVLLGTLLTSIVQSSSATMALALSALHAQAITLPVAMAIVLGAEIGTTLKLFIASAKGSAVKKRAAWGNFIFNTGTVLVIVFLLDPIGTMIHSLLGPGKNLIALVFFQSLVNLVSILLFFPLLKTIARFLQERFSGEGEGESFIRKIADKQDADTTLQAIEHETGDFLRMSIVFSLEAFNLSTTKVSFAQPRKVYSKKPLAEKYEQLKNLHGELHNFCLKLQSQLTTAADQDRLGRMIMTIRNTMYASKSIRDALLDIQQMRNSSNDTKYEFYLTAQNKINDLCNRILSFLDKENGENKFEGMRALHQSVTEGYSRALKQLYRETTSGKISELEISTLINFNRELYTSFKSMLIAVKEYCLWGTEAAYFDDQPGFIH